jgi:hypothetical protein
VARPLKQERAEERIAGVERPGLDTVDDGNEVREGYPALAVAVVLGDYCLDCFLGNPLANFPEGKCLQQQQQQMQRR